MNAALQQTNAQRSEINARSVQMVQLKAGLAFIQMRERRCWRKRELKAAFDKPLPESHQNELFTRPSPTCVL